MDLAKDPLQQSRLIGKSKAGSGSLATSTTIKSLFRKFDNMSISMSIEYLLLYLPLLVAVSFVMGATRHEKPNLILHQTQRTAIWITSFMLTIYAVLQIVSWIV